MQKSPRVRDPKYLAWLRQQRCACCGVSGPCDAAHLRSASPAHGKQMTGWGKPDDRWALPLKHAHHMAQHGHSEIAWWQAHGVADPFALAQSYYRRFRREQRG